MKRYLQLAQKILQTNSLTPSGNEEVSNLFAGIMTDAGIKTNLQLVTSSNNSNDEFSKRQFNVLGYLGDSLVDRKIFKGLLLTSPIDTPPFDAETVSNRSQSESDGQVIENQLFGAGAVGGKVDFLCKVLATEKFREKKLKMPVYLGGTCLSHFGFAGTRYLIKSLAFNPKYICTHSPTQLRLGVSNKSVHSFKIQLHFHQIERDSHGYNRKIDLAVKGKAAHLFNLEKSTNATNLLTETLSKLKEKFEMKFTDLRSGNGFYQIPEKASSQFFLKSNQLEAFKEMTAKEFASDVYSFEMGGIGDSGVKMIPDKIFECYFDLFSFFESVNMDLKRQQDPHFGPPHSFVQNTKIRTLSKMIELSFDLLVLPSADFSVVQNSIKSGIASIASRFPELNLTLSWEKPIPPFQAIAFPDWTRMFEETLSQNFLDKTPCYGSSTTDAALFSEAKYATVFWGPGLDLEKGTREEKIPTEQIEKAIGFYIKLIERVCL